MNKKLIAVAVASAMAAPAVAFAQASTVQIYGKLTVEYASVDAGPNVIKSDQSDVPGGSAIGFKGEEKLGGGLSAWFQCESSADTRGMDQGGFCTRNSALGFKGGFGNVFHGRWDTPMKRALNVGTVGAQETGALGASFLAFGGSGGADANGGTGSAAADQTGNSRARWKRRETSITYYESPNFSGFQLLAGITAANGAVGQANNTTAAKPRTMSFAGIYNKGPLGIGLGYEIHSDFAGQGGFSGDDTGLGLSAAYTMGKVKVGATYLAANYETGIGAETKKKTYTVGVAWDIAGPHGLEAQYGHAGDTKGNGAGIQAGSRQGVRAPGADTGGSQISLAYVNKLSKRTQVRLIYTKINNDRNAGYALGNQDQDVGQDMNAFGIHVGHRF